MRWKQELCFIVRRLVHRRRAERELDEEIRVHLEMEVERNVADGMSPEEARLAARRSFGSVAIAKEDSRMMWGLRSLEILWQDLRYGARILLKNSGFTLIAVITLALGIGANTAIFSIVNGLLLRPLPYKDSQQLVTLWVTRPPGGRSPLSSTSLTALRQQNQVFEQVAAFISQPFNLTGRGEPEFLGNVVASANLFSLLSAKPMYGRVFLPEEEQPGKHRVVILSYDLWQRRFGSDPEIIGGTISLNFEPYTIVGVMPQGFQFPRKGDFPGGWPIPYEIDIYTPTAFAPEQWNNRRAVSVIVIARLKPQIGLEQAQADMNGFARWLQRQSPDTDRDVGIGIETLHQQVVGRVKPALLVLLGAVGFVLLIACANVANLMLARATGRRKEIAIRIALGAGRARVIRQLLTESALLAVVSGLLALLMAFWGVDLLRTVIPEDLPRADEISIDGQVFGFTLLISLLTGILFGLVPALQASRLSLNNALKEGGRNSGEIGRHRFRNLLVVSEVALALALLIGAGLMLRSFMRLTSVDPGLDTKNVLTADIRLPRSRYSPPQQAAFFQRLFERLRLVPGVQAASAAYPAPLSGAEEGIGFNIEGEPPPASGQWNHLARPRGIGPDYFKALNIQLQKGRIFRESDNIDAPPVLVINDVLARQYWPNEDPIGKRMNISLPNIQPGWREIIGVVKSVRHMGLNDELHPEIYFPVAQFPWPNLTLVVRTSGDPLNLVAAVRNQVLAIDKDQPISNIHTMDELLAKTVSQPRFNFLLLAIFSGVALMLAAVGIYGVMSYLVTERTHEIGVRTALGAQTRDVLILVIRQGMALTLTGVVIGLIAAFGLTRLMRNLLFGVSATDLPTFAIVALILAIVALLACWIPARRATKVDPLIALRCE